MMDSKVINILKKMKEEEKNLIGTDIDTDIKDYTHGDKAEALNTAIFELEHKDEFYIDKSVIEDKIEELKISGKTEIRNNKNEVIEEHYFLQDEIDILKELLGDE